MDKWPTFNTPSTRMGIDPRFFAKRPRWSVWLQWQFCARIGLVDKFFSRVEVSDDTSTQPCEMRCKAWRDLDGARSFARTSSSTAELLAEIHVLVQLLRRSSLFSAVLLTERDGMLLQLVTENSNGSSRHTTQEGNKSLLLKLRK